MTVFDSDPNIRWLFCLTHPDDELAVAAWIAHLAKNGNSVWMMWTHSTPTREMESRAVAKRLGVHQNHLIFANGTDGVICDEMYELLPLFRRVMQEVAPDRVVCAAFEQGHLDHDATNWLVNHSFDGPVFEFPMYRTYRFPLQVLNRFSRTEGQEVRLLSEEERRLKVEVAQSYPSQSIWRIVCAYHFVHRHLLRRPVPLAASERMRRQTHFNYLRPNHPEPLAKKVMDCDAWQRWTRSVKAAQRPRVRTPEALADRLLSETP